VVKIDSQLHGYRQGHQLLASSTPLPKSDQSIIDRLSDVAGPLRPKERFEPYLSGYPLPSGSHYVVARTWQDLSIPRAGCVRTRSLLIPTEAWAAAPNLADFLDFLAPGPLPTEADIIQRAVTLSTRPAALPPTPGLRASELLEALFLEEAKPVAIFDAPTPELVAIRLLTALWPTIRQRFAISTLALSPRKIAGRDFDLVFAPKDARSKFVDWPGRRVDGQAAPGARHKWTSAIVGRVFEEPFPRLLTDQELGLVGAEADGTAALRIALLWDELLGTLDRNPAAALGLLDIANSGMVRNSEAISALEPALVEAVRRATVSLPSTESWDFLGAIARKIQGRRMPEGIRAVEDVADELAGRSPEGAIALLEQPDPKGAITELLPSIARGLATNLDGRTEAALMGATPRVLGGLLAEGGPLVARVTSSVPLVERLGAVLPSLEPALFDAVGRELLPQLVEDWQILAARPLIASLDERGLVEEVRRLGAANGFAAESFVAPLTQRARDLDAVEELRAALIDQPRSGGRDAFLAKSLEPLTTDVRWLFGELGLDVDLARQLLVALMSDAQTAQVCALLSDSDIGTGLIARLHDTAPDVLLNAAFRGELDINTYVAVIMAVLPSLDPRKRADLAWSALHRCLPERFQGDEVWTLSTLIGWVGEFLDGARTAQLGLHRIVDPSTVSRNILAFDRAPDLARVRLVRAVDELARALADRHTLQLSADAANACARLLLDAQHQSERTLLTAAGTLLPLLMRSRQEPISSMVAAMFPVVYRELAKVDDVPELLKFVPFFDWDRCKAARYELVSAFTSSTKWRAGDLALTACRCADVGKIMRRVAKSYGGDAYLSRIEADISWLPNPCGAEVKRTIKTIQSDWSAKYDWRD